MTHLLDRETALTRGADPDLAQRPITEVYVNFNGAAFGGWTLASAIEAAQSHPQWRGAALTANASFLDGLRGGDAFFRTRLLSRKRSTDFWRVEIYTDAAETNLAFAADIVAGLERDPAESYEAPPPYSGAPEDKAVLEAATGPNWISTFEIRPIKGRAFVDGDDPLSLNWIRFADARPLDRKGLAAMCDTPMPRIFMISAVRRFVSTFTLTFTVNANEETIRRVGERPVLIETSSDRIGEGRFHQRARIWSETGDMLAVSEQVAVYGKPMD